jgi:hypothetical protein
LYTCRFEDVILCHFPEGVSMGPFGALAGAEKVVAGESPKRTLRNSSGSIRVLRRSLRNGVGPTRVSS